MVLLILAFIAITVFCFGIFVFMMRPTTEQKSMTSRIMAIKTPRGQYGEAIVSIDSFLTTQPTGSFAWLDQRMEASEFYRKTRLLILQSDSKTTVGTLVITSLGFGGAALFVSYLFLHILLLSVGLAGLASYLPFLNLNFKRDKRIKNFNNALAECIDMMSRSMRAGHSLQAAIAIVADQAVEPNKSEFAEVFKTTNYGLPLREALMQLLDRVPSQDLRVLVTGILVQKDTGGNLTEILDRIVHVIRERVRIQGEIATHTAQGRFTGYILSALPLVMLVLINMINPGYSKILFTDPFGRKLLYTGGVLLFMGNYLITKIVNGIEV